MFNLFENLSLNLRQTELLEMTLTLLSINDLNSCLAISEQWHTTILGSHVLRHTLFLDPSPTRVYIKSITQNGQRPVYTLPRQPVKGSFAIIDPHPAILPLTESHEVWVKETRWIDCDLLRNVHPMTLVFQPPIKKVIVWQRRENSSRKSIHEVVRPEGVTFGALLGAIRVKREKHEEACSKTSNECCHGTAGGRETCKLYAWGAVTTCQDEARSARGAVAKSGSSIL